MALSKDKKKKMLVEIQEGLKNAKTCVLSDYSKVEVSDIQDVRKKLRESKAYMKVVKNTLFKKALDDNKLKVEDEVLTKPLAIAFDENDEVNPAKIMYEKAKEVENLNILGALVNGEFFGPEKVSELAKMPSREELYAKVVGSIGAPISGLVNVLAGNMRGLINVLNARKEKIGE